MAGISAWMWSMVPLLKHMISLIVILLCLEILLVDEISGYTTGCGAGQFLDTDSGMCEFCAVICENAKQQGTYLKCLQNCPGFLTTTTPTPTLPPKDILTTTASSVSTPGYFPIANAILVAVAVVVCAVIALAAAVHYRQRLKELAHGFLYRCKLTHVELKYPIPEVGPEDNDTRTEDDSPPDETLIGPSTSVNGD